MISMPLFKQNWKSNIKMLVVFTIALCVFITVMCYVFTPAALDGLQKVDTGLVGNLLGGANTLIGFVGNSFFAIMAIIFPMIYSIMVGNKLIAEKVDQGTMAGLLATPNKRIKIIFTCALFFILSLIAMWLIVFLIGVLAANIFQPGHLDINAFCRLCFGCFLYHFVISGICFFSSTIFNTSKMAVSIGGGISLFFFLVNLIVKLSSDLDILKYFTLNTLFDTTKLISGDQYIGNLIIMFSLGAVLYIGSLIIFPKKDLPL